MKRIGIALLSALCISIFPAISAIAPKAGASCAKSGITSTYQGKKYTCIKKGKTLVWDGGVTIKQVTPAKIPITSISPTPSITPTSTASLSPTPSPTPVVNPDDINFKVCTKVNEIVRNTVGEFWCLEQNGELRWSKNNVDNNPKANTPSPSPTSTRVRSTKVLTGESCSFRYQIVRNASGAFICTLLGNSLSWKIWIDATPASGPTSPTSSVVDPYENKPCQTENEELRLGISTAPDYKCIKTANGTLLWAKNNAVILVRPTPASTVKPDTYIRTFDDAYTPPSISGESIDTCKLIEKTTPVFTNVKMGFPLLQPYMKNIGTVKMLLVPIDFADYPGDEAKLTKFNEQVKTMADWYSMVSEGKLNLEWSVAKSWTRLSGSISDYAVPRSGAYPATANFWKKVLSEIDPKFNFSGIQVVNFVMPSGQKVVPEGVQSFPWESEMTQYVSQEGPLISFALPGTFFEDYRRFMWVYYAHEFGHVLGFAHPGAQGTYDNPETSYWDDILMYDMMGNQDGFSKGLYGWFRFLTAWLSDNQVLCTNLSDKMNFEMTLVPSYSNLEGYKLALIKVSPTKIVAIESRRYNSFDCSAEEIGDGVIAYSYDSTKGHDQASMHGAIPIGRELISYDSDCGPVTGKEGKVHNLSMYPGDEAIIEGVKIRVIRSGRYDLIQVLKN